MKHPRWRSLFQASGRSFRFANYHLSRAEYVSEIANDDIVPEHIRGDRCHRHAKKILAFDSLENYNRDTVP